MPAEGLIVGVHFSRIPAALSKAVERQSESDAPLSTASRRVKSKSWPIRIVGDWVVIGSDPTISPVQLSLGILKPGQSVTKQLLIRGKTPFKITGIQCEDCISADASTDSKRVHVVPIVYTAGSSLGRFSHDIRVRTNLGGGLATVCQAKVTVRAGVSYSKSTTRHR